MPTKQRKEKVGRTTVRERKQCLSFVPLFRRCTSREIGAIAEAVVDRDVTAGTVLCQEGDEGEEFFIIVSGRAAVTRGGAELAELSNGAFFGEMAMLDGGPRTSSVTATTDLRLLVLNRKRFHELLGRSPTMAQKLLTELACRLRTVEGELNRLRDALTGQVDATRW